MTKLKKNCHNCKSGLYESDGEYGEYTYFVCEKREDDGYNNLEKNLARPKYLEKAKVCCDLSEQTVELKCKQCGDVEMGFAEHKETHICFDCFCCNEESAKHNSIR